MRGSDSSGCTTIGEWLGEGGGAFLYASYYGECKFLFSL